jgi:hypothetical protein
MNSILPGGYEAAATGYIATSAADATFYANYDGTDAMELVRRRNVGGDSTPADPIWAAEEEAQSDLLRCVVGNPFRPPHPLTATVAGWNEGTIVKLALAIYNDRAFDRLPILADALLEAGCEDADLLGHLRGPGPHVRGCWAVDLLLGKE